jgi:endonuclease/exonuclease/phosphatase family metal-dependent hydrolase
MKIYSWNVYCFNKKVDEVTSFIRELDFDVLCLQEVTPALLERLKELPFHLTYHIDVIRLFSKKRIEKNYVAILSRHPVRASNTLQFFDFPFPLHTRVFITLMRLVNWSFITERGAVYADVEVENALVRVFSVHLTLWGPTNRKNEFEAVLGHVEPNGPTIVCGDFNVIEYGPMKILNWLLGAPLKEATPWYPERDLFEERFKEAGFTNPLRGSVTHTFSKSQLDHILVSADMKTTSAWVHPEKRGSDHQPVGVEVSLLA